MRKKELNTDRTIALTLAEKKMLQEVIDNMQDKPLFEEKKASILACIDEEKSKQGELIVTVI